jgi:hypothetical protein
MRTTFTIELQADINTDDGAGRAAFNALLRDNSETLYAQCAMISRRPPTIVVTVCDEEVGTVSIPLFSDSYEEDYSESEGE